MIQKKSQKMSKQKKKNMKIIPQHAPLFDKFDAKAVHKVIQSGWVSEGPETKRFEESFRKFIGTKYAIATTNGTSAIFLALSACGIKANDQVIVPNLTFVATANAVKLLGAKPVLAEINENDFTISIKSIKKKITNKTKAVIPVHLNGRSTNLDELKEICKKFDLKMIEDSSQSLGSKYKKKYLGSKGDANAFSLSAPKIITTGQGGMVTTNKFEVFDELRKLKDHGRYDKSDYHPKIGYNFKFNDIQAALGNSQFAKIKTRLKKTKTIHKWYRKLLEKENSVVLPLTEPEIHLWYFDILIKNRDKLAKFLLKSKIRTRSFYKPLNTHVPYKTKNKFPISKNISSLGLYLPSSSNLTFQEIEYICDKIHSFYMIKG